MPGRKAALKAVKLSTFLALALAGCGGGSSTPPPAITVSVSAAAKNVDEGQGTTLTATVINDTSNKGVTWSISCSTSGCGSLSSQSGSPVTYTAPNAVTTGFSATITATSVADSSKSGSGAVSVAAPPSVTTTSLPSATGGMAYNAALQETGGVGPYTWGLTGTNGLPPGLDLGTDGTISGTPMQGGNSQFTVQVSDSGSPPLTASENLTINVTVNPLSVSTTSLPDASVDADYTQPLQASGGIPPYTWTVSGGSLPSWATLDPSGNIAGIPGVIGTTNFTVQVTDSQSTALTSTQPLAIHVKTSASANDSELKGQYAFLFSGWDDASGSQEAVIGSIVADGGGTISSGIEDENGPNGTSLSVSLTGTYYVGANNRGAMTLTTASGSRTFAFTLSAVNGGLAPRGRFIEYDDTSGTTGQRGSGVMRLQDASAFAIGKISGSYAFEFAGQDQSANRQAIAGAITADGAGTIPSGTADQNVAGTLTNPSLTGNYAAPSNATGRGTMKIIPFGASTLNLTIYVVSATDFLAMETDAFSTAGVLSGSLLAQTSTSFTTSALDAPSVYYQVGSSHFEVGLFVPDGNGNLNVTYDNQVGKGISSDASFAGTYTVSTGGRVAVSSGDNTTSALLYLVDKNKGYFLDPGASVGVGFVEPQTVPAGGFTNASLSGTFSAVTLTPGTAGHFNIAGIATLDGASAFSQTADISWTGGLTLNQNTTQKYSIDASGRGVITQLNANGSNIPAALLTLGIGAIVIGTAGRRKHARGSGFALFSLAVFFAATPAGCPCTSCHNVNQTAFYVISPQKAVSVHQIELIYTSTEPPEAVVSILEQ